MSGIDLVGPQFAVLVTAAIVLLVDGLLPQHRRYLPLIAIAGVAASALWTTSWVGRGDYQEAFDGTLALDKYAIFFYYLFAGITATVILASIDWVNREGRGQGEYYALVLTTSAGLMFLAAARDLITIFLALELSSIPQYVLAGLAKDKKTNDYRRIQCPAGTPEIQLKPGVIVPVTRGCRIGFTGDWGVAGSPHLHFEVRRGVTTESALQNAQNPHES